MLTVHESRERHMAEHRPSSCGCPICPLLLQHRLRACGSMTRLYSASHRKASLLRVRTFVNEVRVPEGARR